MDICITRKVDFIVISGDLFHVGVPSDLDTVKQAVAKMREVTQQGIPIYAIYGSHDYTPTSTSIIDVIESAGLLTKIVRGTVVEDKLKLECVVVHADTDLIEILLNCSSGRAKVSDLRGL